MPKRLTPDERGDRAMLEAEVVAKTLEVLAEYDFRACHLPDSRRLQGDRGAPDIIAVRPPHLVFIECKRQVNIKHPPHQVAWQEDLRDSGAMVWIVQPADLRTGRLALALAGLGTE